MDANKENNSKKGVDFKAVGIPESCLVPTTYQNTDEKLFKPISGATKLKYFFIRASIKTASKTIAVMPERLAYSICVGISMLGFHAVPAFRRLARGHIEIAFGAEKSQKEIDAILRQTYINQGKNLAEFLMLPHRSADWVLKKIVCHDDCEPLMSELRKGRGAIALGAHIGNIELACAWIGIKKIPMVTVVKAQRDELFTKYITQVRARWGTKMLFRLKGVKEECLAQLKENNIVGLVADQNAARNGVFVDFFGKKAATAPGPALIAMETGLPVVPCFWTTRNPDNTLTMHTMPPIPMKNTGAGDADIKDNVQAYTKAIEDFIRRYPAEYLWWHRRWKTRERPAADTQPPQ